jgi:glycosyltransferase involved in cell wall biosynthesis
MKIVFFTDFFHPSIEGVTASVTLFSNALRRQGHRVYIVAPAHTKPLPGEHPDVIRLPSVPSVWHKGMRDGILTPKLGKVIKDLDADIYHFHSLGMTGMAGMRLMMDLDLPSVSTYHTDWEHYAKVYRGMWAGLVTGSLLGPFIVNQPKAWPETVSGMKPKRSLKEWNDNMVHNLIRVSNEYFDMIIAPSNKMKVMLEGYRVSRPIKVLATGIDPDDFMVKVARATSTTTELLYVGRIAKEKNIDVLFTAMQILKRRKANVRLRLVGPGPYLARMRQKVRENNLQSHITLAGGLPRKAALATYGESDIFVFPSLTDTQALVLNEAAFCGLPLLFSDPDISALALNGVTGRFVEPTGEAYADAIEELSQKKALQKQYGKAAQAAAQSIIIDQQATKLVTIYKKAIKSHDQAEA